MDVRRVGEALLRLHPINTFSGVSRPSQHQRSRLLSNRNVSRHISELSRRAFTSSTPKPQQNAPKEDDSAPQQSSQASPSLSDQQQPQQRSNSVTFGNLLNSATGRTGGMRETARGTESSSSTSTSNEGKQVARAAYGQIAVGRAPSTTSSLEDAMTQRAAATAANSPTALSLRNLFQNTVLTKRDGPQRKMNWNYPPTDSTALIEHSLMEPPEVDSLPRLGPSYGRTVYVQDNDLVGAMRRMDARVTSNGIRKAYHYQKFHERPGLKRKRLARERWRARFMQGFKATVQTVKHLKKQGW